MRYTTLAVLTVVAWSSLPLPAAYFLAREPFAPIILSPPFGHHSGYAYASRVDLKTSNIAVYENGLRLGPHLASDKDEDVCLSGNGRYVFREIDQTYHVNGIIFSASDNSDPNTNGRLYRVYNLNAEDVRQRAPSD